MSVKQILLLRPIDSRIYREARVTGLTSILYAIPWSVTLTLMLGLLTAYWFSV